MNDGIKIALRFLVTGPIACFRRPEFVKDFISYDVISPLAARRMIRTIYDSEARIEIEQIYVLRPVILEWRSLDGLQLLALRDVAYVISVTLHIDSDRDQSAIVQRYPVEPRTTYLGLQSLQGEIRRIEKDEIFASELADQTATDLGWMIFDVIGRGRARARFFRPVMVGGVIDVGRERGGRLPG